MTAIVGKFEKQPGETLDYYVIYDDWFANRSDAAASISVTADAGITIVASSLTGSTVKIVLSGGTTGVKYKITVLLTTDAAIPIIKEVDFTVTVKAV